MSPVEMWGTPKRLESRFACVPLPLPGGPMKISFTCSLPSPPADTAAFHESVVMAHDELRFDLLDRIHRHADDDEEGGSTEVEVEAHTRRHPGRQHPVEPGAEAERQLGHVDAGDEELGEDADGGQVDRADECDAGQHAVDVVGRLFAGAD